MQNETLQTMSTTISREIADDIRKSFFFTVMADKTTDASNRGQLVTVLRHVDTTLTPQEIFLSLCTLAKMDTDTLTQSIRDC